jgi:hypothetical protein
VNQTTRTILIVFGAVVAGAILLLGGMFIGRSTAGQGGFWPGNMMGGTFAPAAFGQAGVQFNHQLGAGMMGAYGQTDPEGPCSDYGMMGGYGQAGPDSTCSGYGMMGAGMMSPDMMGSFGSSGLLEAAPLTPTEAQQAVQNYIDGLANADLAVGEVMIFDNHAYAQIIEESTGIGAMEVLVNPVTKAVYPEHGPNMMWNLKYSPMSGSEMMGMMGGFEHTGRGMMGNLPGNPSPEEISAEMPVSPDQAIAAAQDYLDTSFPGTEAEGHTDAFYGYYTLHILRDGEVIGMLSVNGFTSQVFPHTWHGDFLQMAESNHD